MAITKQLALTSTPQNIIVRTVCNRLTMKEDEGVANWPTSDLLIAKGSGDSNRITAGKAYDFDCPIGSPFMPGMILGTVAVPGASTTGLQDEQ